MRKRWIRRCGSIFARRASEGDSGARVRKGCPRSDGAPHIACQGSEVAVAAYPGLQTGEAGDGSFHDPQGRASLYACGMGVPGARQGAHVHRPCLPHGHRADTEDTDTYRPPYLRLRHTYRS